MTRFSYKFLLTVVVMLASVFTCFSQTVKYTYKPMKDLGCNVSYNVVKQDSTYYIVCTVSSDRMTFMDEPTIMLKTFDGDMIKLNGNNSGDLTKTSGGVVIGNVVTSSSSIISTALFITSPEQFELIKKGISKVRLSTIPIEHERTFKKDKIGAKLYDFYSELEAREDF